MRILHLLEKISIPRQVSTKIYDIISTFFDILTALKDGDSRNRFRNFLFHRPTAKFLPWLRGESPGIHAGDDETSLTDDNAKAFIDAVGGEEKLSSMFADERYGLPYELRKFVPY